MPERAGYEESAHLYDRFDAKPSTLSIPRRR
jgi:hypothetical protein